MKRRLFVCVLVTVLVLLLAGCGCKHEWMAATCEDPKTCSLCGETEGETLDHDWEDADCTTPKTCSECDKTKGEALGHKWQDATCTAAKTCSVCKATEGEAAGHTWTEATCTAPKTCSVCKATEGAVGSHVWEEATTEAPKTCSVCKATEGEKLKVDDSRFTTTATKDLHGTWTSDVNMTADMMGLDKGFENGIDCVMTMEFGKTGELKISLKVKDEAAFNADFKAYTLQTLYDTLQQQGMSKDQAEQAIKAQYGMTVEEYIDSQLKNMDISALFAMFKQEGVYYVQGSEFYMGETWSGSFQKSAFSVKDGVLIINEMENPEGTAPMQWKKAE